MPHFVIEYSRGVEDRHDIKEMMQIAFDAGVATNEMTADALKVRTKAYDDFLMENDTHSFVHVTVFLLSGRTEEQKLHIGGMLHSRLDAFLTSVTSLTVDIRDMNRPVYQKRVL